MRYCVSSSRTSKHEARDFVVDILYPGFDVLLELPNLGIVIRDKIGIHFNPLVPIHFPDPHCYKVRAMAEGSIELGIRKLKFVVLRRFR